MFMKWAFLTVIAIACVKTPTNSDDGTPQLLWSLPQSDGALIEGVFPKFIFGNSVIWHGWYNTQPKIIARDKNTGQIQWQWNDTFDSRRLAINGQIYVANNILLFRDGGRLYTVDVSSGKTIWRTRVNAAFVGADVQGIGNTIFFSASQVQGFSADALSGNVREILSVRPDKGAFLWTVQPCTYNNDTLLVVPFVISPAVGKDSAAFLLFNITQNKVLYTQSVLDTTQFQAFYGIIIQNNKIFMAENRSILCCDLLTGKQLWRQDFPGDFLFSHIALADGKIIGNCENQYMYALDPDNGTILWTERTSGTSSRPFVMNSVIYFTGGGDGLLHALDAATGKHIWKLESPDLKRNGGAWFFDTVTGADGKIYVSSYLSLFCYKAAR